MKIEYLVVSKDKTGRVRIEGFHSLEAAEGTFCQRQEVQYKPIALCSVVWAEGKVRDLCES